MTFAGLVAAGLMATCLAAAPSHAVASQDSREEALAAAVEDARATIESIEGEADTLSEEQIEELEGAAGALRRSLMFETSAPEETRALLGRAFELLERYADAYRQYGEYLDRHPEGRSASVARERRKALRQQIDVRLLEGEIDPPIRHYTPQPVYPESLKSRGVEGTVTISAVIDELGRVTEPRVISSPDAELSQAALEVVATWQFLPARSPDGRPVAASYMMTFDFNRPR